MAQAQQQQSQRQQGQQQGKQVTTAEYLNGIQEALMKQIAEKMGAIVNSLIIKITLPDYLCENILDRLDAVFLTNLRV